MSHIDLRYTVQGSIVSSDTDLLDAIESALPAEGDDILGNEYNISRTQIEDSPNERLSARMTFTDDQKLNPKDAALSLFNQVKSHDLAAKADGWELQVYKSPEGAVRASNVRGWYEEDESRQPTRIDEDGNGESYTPSIFDPSNHVIESAQS